MPSAKPSTSELWVCRPGRVPYETSERMQRSLVQARRAGRLPDLLLLLEHPPVITLGTGSHAEHLLSDAATLREQGIALHECNRGGDVTWHGPGQLVGYPILDLCAHRTDVHWYVRTLEEVLIATLAEFGLHGERVPGRTGVWIGGSKVAAIGVHIAHWVTSHGFALNVDPDLSHFAHIIPCGIADAGVTSMAFAGTNRTYGTNLSAVSDTVIPHFIKFFGFAHLVEISWDALSQIAEPSPKAHTEPKGAVAHA